MSFLEEYEADFECPKGHRFTAKVGEGRKERQLCPTCYAEWIAANVSVGVKVSEPRKVNPLNALFGLDAG
jgi:hypothetical protein